MTRLNGKTALITGSTDGVGRLVAKRLGGAAAHVLVHGRDRERGERLVAEINEGGGSAEFLVADFSALAEVRRLADAVQQRTDRLDWPPRPLSKGGAASTSTGCRKRAPTGRRMTQRHASASKRSASN